MIVALFSSVSQIAAATCERRVRLISPNSKLLIAVSIGANLAITSLTLSPSNEKTSGEIVEATIVDPVFYDKNGSKQNV